MIRLIKLVYKSAVIISLQSNGKMERDVGKTICFVYFVYFVYIIPHVELICLAWYKSLYIYTVRAFPMTMYI